MNYILLVYILPILSILFSLVALVVGIAGLAMVIGLKNSTHQVVWKPVEEPSNSKNPDFDPFFTVEDEVKEMENPNKRIKREDDLVDLTDPAVTSNAW